MANKLIPELGEAPLVKPGTSFHDVTEIVSRVTENPAPRGWWILFLTSVSITGALGEFMPNGCGFAVALGAFRQIIIPVEQITALLR